MENVMMAENELSQALEMIYLAAWPEIMGILWISLVSMAILQILKDVTPFRRWFQRRSFAGWLDGRQGSIDELDLPKALGAQSPTTEKSITKAYLKSIFCLPLEQFVGQLSAAAFRAMESIKSEESSDQTDDESVNQFLKVFTVNFDGDEKRPITQQQLSAASHQIQRSLDALTAHMRRRWRFTLRALSMIISLLLVATYLWAFAVADTANGTVSFRALIDSPIEWISLFAVIIVASYLAPALHDIFVRLQGKRD